MLFRRPFTIELMPRVVLQEGSSALLRRIPPGTRVFLPHLPASHFDEIVAASVAVQRSGLRPVPHVAARRWRHASEAERALQSLSRAVGHADDGLEVLVLGGTERAVRGGGSAEALGAADEAGLPFDDALALITSGLLSGAGVREVGVAAHPEGIPGVPRAITDGALREKSRALSAAGISVCAVTQFCFDARTLRDLAERLPGLGLDRVSLGVVGPVKPAALAKYARACGVAQPAGAEGSGEYAYLPDALLSELEQLLARRVAPGPAAGEGAQVSLHIYPFGGLERTLDWLEDAAARESSGGDGGAVAATA